MAGFFEKLKEKIFGNPEPKPTARTRRSETVPRSESPTQKLEPEQERPSTQAPTKFLEPERLQRTKIPHRKVSSPRPPTNEQSGSPERDPYFVQVGLDFGTAFIKCICRDIFTDKAWIHQPFEKEGAEMPFLISSAVCFDGREFRHPPGNSGSYVREGLHHVKMALEKVASEQWQDPVLEPFRKTGQVESGEQLRNFVECCAVYLLGITIAHIRKDVGTRFPGHLKEDFLAINMAVPVASADDSKINEVFDRVLRIAWLLSDDLCSGQPVPFETLAKMVQWASSKIDQDSVKEACFIYPEVSANVQAFVRSRTSREGLYLFSDTGAGTVDQSVFAYTRRSGKDHLTYLFAKVLPQGSSHLERLAAQQDGDSTWENLERWRQIKESGENRRPLTEAREQVSEQLEQGTYATLSLSKGKLRRKRQLSELRVIFGGGGHCENPYRRAVIKQFDGGLFRRDDILSRKNDGDAFDLGMPVPTDLELHGDQRHWVNRLTVAYGLSFEKGQLASFTLPQDVSMPGEDEIWKPKSKIPQAPSKDEC